MILKWSIGSQDTTKLSSFKDNSDLHKSISLLKLSIYSFQKWFLDSDYYLLYNGENIGEFKKTFDSIEPYLTTDINIIDQVESVRNGSINNPYSFYPIGVWWKWIPFRIDINQTEIYIDSDIICIGEPKSWFDWINSSSEIIVAPERFEKISKSTCGDFYDHPILSGKSPINCGIVGQKEGIDYAAQFFEICNSIDYGNTRDSMFITEQGATNMWVYSMESLGSSFTVLDFAKNAWIRDFIYHINKGVNVETVHAISWHKSIVHELRDVFVKKIQGLSYDMFVKEIVERANELDVNQGRLISNQMALHCGSTEFFL